MDTIKDNSTDDGGRDVEFRDLFDVGNIVKYACYGYRYSVRHCQQLVQPLYYYTLYYALSILGAEVFAHSAIQNYSASCMCTYLISCHVCIN